jgi:hypothetical protein
MHTNEDLAKWAEQRAASIVQFDGGAAMKLRSIANALRRLDAQDDADNRLFHVAFDNQTMPGKLVVTTVRLGVEVLGEHQSMVKKFNVALCNHPSYQNLRGYVLANPEACPDVPEKLVMGVPPEQPPEQPPGVN